MAKNKSNLHAEIERDGETVSPGLPEVNFVGAERDPLLVTEVRLIEDIVKNKYCLRNVTYPGSVEAFESDPRFQTIERFFPIAEGGALYVDQINEADKEDLPKIEIKKQLMRKAGLRYLVLTKDTDMIDAERQLRVSTK